MREEGAGPDGSVLSEGLGPRAMCPHEAAVNDWRLHNSDTAAREPMPASLAGRCANGYERGQGVRVHAVPYSDELARNGYATQRAVCGAKPGPRSAGWSYSGMRPVTCPRCVKKAGPGA